MRIVPYNRSIPGTIRMRNDYKRLGAHCQRPLAAVRIRFQGRTKGDEVNKMDKKKEAVKLLKKYDGLCHARENLRKLVGMDGGEAYIQDLCDIQRTLGVIQKGLGALTPEQMLILSRFYIYREKGYPQYLCQALGVEQSTVYRRKDRALGKFIEAVFGPCTEPGESLPL